MQSEGEAYIPLDTLVSLVIDAAGKTSKKDHNEGLKLFLRTLHDGILTALPPDSSEHTHTQLRIQLSYIRDALEEL